ncbi:MAG: UDP-glucuronate 4-epimerase [bacterium]|jgi:UDP-glucuronate 4-epimerase
MSAVQLMDFIKAIEKATGKEAHKNYLPMQDGDVPATYADVDDLINDVGFKPNTNIEDGIQNFVAWYRDYYQV